MRAHRRTRRLVRDVVWLASLGLPPTITEAAGGLADPFVEPVVLAAVCWLLRRLEPGCQGGSEWPCSDRAEHRCTRSRMIASTPLALSLSLANPFAHANHHPVRHIQL